MFCFIYSQLKDLRQAAKAQKRRAERVVQRLPSTNMSHSYSFTTPCLQPAARFPIPQRAGPRADGPAGRGHIPTSQSIPPKTRPRSRLPIAARSRRRPSPHLCRRDGKPDAGLQDVDDRRTEDPPAGSECLSAHGLPESCITHRPSTSWKAMHQRAFHRAGHAQLPPPRRWWPDGSRPPAGWNRSSRGLRRTRR